MSLRELVLGWQDQALCRHYSYGGVGEFYRMDLSRDDRTMLRRVCGDCPVQPDCLATAMIEERDVGLVSRFGFRGGFTPTERHRLAKRWRYNDEDDR